MKTLVFFAAIMLVGCAVNTEEQTSGAKGIGVGTASSAQDDNYNALASMCPQLVEVYPEHSDIFTEKRELVNLQKDYTMNFRYYEYSNPFNGPNKQIIAISDETATKMQNKNILCTSVLYADGSRKGKPTGEMGINIPNIKSPYNQLNFGVDTKVVVLEMNYVETRPDSFGNLSYLFIVETFDGEKPSDSGAMRANTAIYIDMDNNSVWKHVKFPAAQQNVDSAPIIVYPPPRP